MQKIIAFFMSIIAFIMSLFGLTPKTPGVNSYTDLTYGTVSKSQNLDLYIPDKDITTAGLIVMIHGGAWMSGDKSSETETAKYIAKDYGYVAASINYRMLGENATYTDMLDDIASALALIKQKAADEGIAINNCGLVGYSAGAHLALLYAYKNHAVSPIPVAYAASLAGPTDLTDPNFFDADWKVQCAGALVGASDMTLDNLQNYKSELLAASPVNYVAADVPASILCHGTADDTVPYSNAVTLSQKLDAAGAAYKLITYEGKNHTNLSEDKESSNLYYQTLVEWSRNAFGY